MTPLRMYHTYKPIEFTQLIRQTLVFFQILFISFSVESFSNEYSFFVSHMNVNLILIVIIIILTQHLWWFGLCLRIFR